MTSPRPVPVPASATPDAVPGTVLLSVVIPCYNERFTLRELVRRVMGVPVDKEVVIVDDGSTDGTLDILAGLEQRYTNLRVIRQPRNQGKGAAIRRGVQEARGEFTIIQDADLEYDPNEYPELLEPLLSGQADVVYGSRFASGHRRVHLFWHAVGNKWLTLATNLITNLNLTDMETCYKVFRTELIQQIPLRSNRFGFEPEVTVKVAKLGCRIYEVPISYNGRDYAEGKKIGLKDAFSALWTLLKFWFSSDIGEVGRHTLARMAELGSYNVEMYERLRPFIGRRVLEAGAGVGNLSRLMLDRDLLVLSDYEREYLRLLRRRFGTYENVVIEHVDLSTFTAADMAGYAIDTVVCLNVLEHIEDDRRVLAELHETLADGGNLVLLVPAHQALFSDLDRNLGHYRRYSREELSAKLRDAGFDVVHASYFNWIGAIGWYVFGRILRRGHITKVATRGYAMVSSLRALEQRHEFGFGLSTIVVGRRRPRAS